MSYQDWTSGFVAEQKLKLSHPIVDDSCSIFYTLWEHSSIVWMKNLIRLPLKHKADPTARQPAGGACSSETVTSLGLDIPAGRVMITNNMTALAFRAIWRSWPSVNFKWQDRH